MSADRSGLHTLSANIPPDEVVYYTEGLGTGDVAERTGTYRTLEHALMGLKATIDASFYRGAIVDASTDAKILHMYRDPGSAVYYVRVDFMNLEALVRLRALR